MFTRLKSFTLECKRVFKVTRKPTKQELGVMIKVTGLGILLIGLIGFLIYLGRQIIQSIL
jgi:protein transport protein SEC61 subunit gamma and related proteins